MNGLLRKEGSGAIILTVLCLFLYLPNLGNRDLWGSVEPQYAQVAREALLEGHWFMPHFNGEIYYTKPPLYFLLVALTSWPVGDVTEFTARLPSALSALGMVLLVYFLGKKLFSERLGLLAGLILATSPQYQQSACMVRIDMPLAFFVTSSLVAFYLGYTSSSRKTYYLLAWFCAALTVLVKGPLAPVLVAIVVFLYLFSRGELRRLKEITPLSGSLVFIATILGWMFLALSEEGHNLSEEGLNHIKNFFMLFTSPNEELYYSKEGYYYIKELFRLLTAYATEEPHAKPFYFYIPEILIGLGPWSLFMIVAIFLFFRKKSEYLRFPCLWFMAMFISLSLIASKHSRYLLPLYPAAALLAAAPWEGYLERPTLPWPKIKALPLLLLASILGLEIALLISHGLPAPAINIALVTIPLIAGIYFALKAAQFRLLFLSLLLTIIVFEFSYYQFLLPRENERKSEKYLCQEILRVMKPGSPWAVYNSFRPAYLFYTKMYPKCIPSEADLNQFLSSPERVYCLLRERDYAAIKLTVYKVLEFEGKKKKDDDLVLVCNMPKG